MAYSNLSFVTYNLHGFNQGVHYLQELLLKYDIVCVQEHWLSSVDEGSLSNLNSDFLMVASYAVDNVLGKGILKGRPYGGVAIFVRSSIIQNFEIICKSDRVIVLKLNNILVCNVYMPCNDDELFNCTLGLICDAIINRSVDVNYWLVLGDFNLKFNKPNSIWETFNVFIQSCDLCLTIDFLPIESRITYRHHSLNQSSMIDYILVSKNLCDLISNVEIQDSGLNLSDYLPVIAQFNVNFNSVNSTYNGRIVKVVESIVKSLRWDKADLSKYYEATYVNVYPIYLELCRICELSVLDDPVFVIQKIYNDIIDALHESDNAIPRVSANFFKHWWNSSLDVLKDISIDCCNLWAAVGKPSSGDIYQKMVQAKNEYKSALQQCKADGDKKFSTELGNSLLEKDRNSFWKSWNSKFKKKSAHASFVGGCNKIENIVEKFRLFFSQTCIPNNESIHKSHKDKFLQEFDSYSLIDDVNDLLTTEMVGAALGKLKKGKAVGVDNVSVEHLIHAHPCLVVSLKILFNLMIINGFVPDDFGKGILIPLLKDTNSDSSLCDNYRGITISCIISKLFEYALLEKYSYLFVTDDLQFGFRNGVGCSDALFTVNSVVNHYIKNGCTVTVSALDISKAFDRISYYALFSKLMQRNFPKQLISVLHSWYTKCFVRVKWKDKLSEVFRTHAGVRQGGVLSPLLFSLYIEDIVVELKRQKKGCMVNKIYLGCVLYADDILLLSQSVSCMQDMLNICSVIARNLDLKFNVKKSTVLRIGKRFNVKCNDLLLDNQIIPFVEEIKYLGIFISCASKFKRSFCSAKIKFYRSFNAIYSKASYASEEVLVNLFQFYCLPVITYACEAVPPSNSDIKSLNKLIACAFQKIFHTFDGDVISDVRDCFRIADVADILHVRKVNFLNRFFKKTYNFSEVIACINGSVVLDY